MSGSARPFGGHRVTYESLATALTCTHGLEVGPGCREAEQSVWAASDDVRVMVVLAVILPEADRADLVPAPLGQGDEAATWTLVGACIGSAFHVHELAHTTIVMRATTSKGPLPGQGATTLATARTRLHPHYGQIA
jgi:hypothetical protein